MAISFCDVPLLLHDPSGTVRAYLANYFSTADARWYAQPATLTGQHARNRDPARVPMPAFNWPASPRPQINTLYYPAIGATRWSVGLFLIDGDSYGKVDAALAQDGSGELVLSDPRS